MFEQKVENLVTPWKTSTASSKKEPYVLEDGDAELEEAIDQLAKLEDSKWEIRFAMDTSAISFLQPSA